MDFSISSSCIDIISLNRLEIGWTSTPIEFIALALYNLALGLFITGGYREEARIETLT